MYFYLSTYVFILVFIIIYVYIIKNNNSNIETLQVQDCKQNTYSPKYISKGKSTFLSSSLAGSMTLEAAMVLPLFIFGILCVANFIVIINYQNIVQMNINNTAKSISRYSYITDRANEITNDNFKDEGIYVDKDVLVAGINTGYALKKLLNNEIVKYTKKVNVYGGISGLIINSSKIGVNEDGTSDLKVSYSIVINILGNKKYHLRLANRCYFHTWIGESIVEKKETNSKIVYITKTGSVYHLSKDCSYIDISVSSARYGDVGNLRNVDGQKYVKCDKCVKSEINENDKVYITPSGNVYHHNQYCGAIAREIIEIDISQIENRDLCSRCKKNGT